MRSSSKKDLSVYDFTKDDLASESKLKFKVKLDSKAHKTDEPIDKYFFLQAFTSGLNCKQKDTSKVQCIDSHEGDDTRLSYVVDTSEINRASVEEKSTFTRGKINCQMEQHGHVCKDAGTRNIVKVDSCSGGACSLVSLEGVNVDVISDDEESWTTESRSPSISLPDSPKNEGLLEHPVLNCTALEEPYDSNLAVVVSPDFITYGKTVYGESQISFFSDCIKVDFSDENGKYEKYVSEWPIDDIIHIHCRCSRSVEVALIVITLRIGVTTTSRTENLYDGSDTGKLIFSVTDVQWLDKVQKIKSLGARYEDIWNVNPNDSLLLEADFVEPNMVYTKHYFSDIVEPFEDLIYPEGDTDAVSLSKRDVALLKPDIFLNDTIIDFYIKYLKNKIQPEQRHRFHFFNSFFFRKLADLDKHPGNASESRAAFLRVRKWTRKVNLFEKDYIFIPVNFNLHWSLIVICHPGEITTLEDVDVHESPKIPCILHMDSIKGSHTGLRTLIQSYLLEERKERHPESPIDHLNKFSNLRFVNLELPQQENSSDCGLFLLHYVELFLEEAPAFVNPFKITKFSTFLSANWFLPVEASLKRPLIQKLIYELINVQSTKVDPSTFNNGHFSAVYEDNDINQAPTIEFLPEDCNFDKNIHDDSTCSVVPNTGIEIELLTTASLDLAQSGKSEELVLQEFFANKAVSEPFPAEGYAETPHRFLSSSPDKDDSQLLAISHIPQIWSTTYALKDDATYEIRLDSIREEVEDDMDLSHESHEDHIASDPKEETVQSSSSSDNCSYVPDTPAIDCNEKSDGCVKNSQEANTATTEAEGGDGDNTDATKVGDNIDVVNPIGEENSWDDGDVPLIGDGLPCQHPLKRRKVTRVERLGKRVRNLGRNCRI